MMRNCPKDKKDFTVLVEQYEKLRHNQHNNTVDVSTETDKNIVTSIMDKEV